MVRSMYIDALNSLESRDVELAKVVILRDRDVNRLYFYITRVIRKKVLTQILEPKTLLKLVDSRMLIRFIEEIGDEAKNAAVASIEMVSKSLEPDPRYVETVKNRINDIDEIYKNIVMKAHERSIDIAELRHLMKICSTVRDSLKHMRIRLAEKNPNFYWFTEFIKSYENIAMDVYDILSLLPFELTSAMIYE